MLRKIKEQKETKKLQLPILYLPWTQNFFNDTIYLHYDGKHLHSYIITEA